jgi:hypothetical protein
LACNTIFIQMERGSATELTNCNTQKLSLRSFVLVHSSCLLHSLEYFPLYLHVQPFEPWRYLLLLTTSRASAPLHHSTNCSLLYCFQYSYSHSFNYRFIAFLSASFLHFAPFVQNLVLKQLISLNSASSQCISVATATSV